MITHPGYRQGIYTNKQLKFKRGGPLGEEVAEWRDAPVTRWTEDQVPMQTFVDKNSLHPMMIRYNGRIMSQWEGDPLYNLEYNQDVWQAVARGVLPDVPGVNLEEEAAKESSVRLRFMNQMNNRDIPQTASSIRYRPTPISMSK